MDTQNCSNKRFGTIKKKSGKSVWVMKNEHKLAIQYNMHDHSNFKEFSEGIF